MESFQDISPGSHFGKSCQLQTAVCVQQAGPDGCGVLRQHIEIVHERSYDILVQFGVVVQDETEFPGGPCNRKVVVFGKPPRFAAFHPDDVGKVGPGLPEMFFAEPICRHNYLIADGGVRDYAPQARVQDVGPVHTDDYDAHLNHIIAKLIKIYHICSYMQVGVLHRRQFIICRHPVEREDFLVLDLGGGFYLSYHKDLTLRSCPAECGGEAVLLGTALCSDGNLNPMSRLAAVRDFGTLCDAVYSFSGRWTVIWNGHILSDPCSLSCLFYGEGEPVVSSSLALIGDCFPRYRPGEGARELVQGQLPDWDISPQTRLCGVRRAFCNQYLLLGESKLEVVRYEPLHPESYACLPVEQRISRIVAGFDCLFRNAASNWNNIVIPMTAGVDSRTLFALARHSGAAFSTVTMEHGMPVSDRRVPECISRITGVPHRFIAAGKLDPGRLDIWRGHTAGACVSEDAYFWAAAQYDEIPSDALLVRGNVWEAFSLYWKWRFAAADGREEILSSASASMPGLAGTSFCQWVDWWLDGKGPFTDWRDAMYFHQRQSCWLGYIEQALDLLECDHIVPLDCAYLMSLILSLPENIREGKKYQKELVRSLSPEISGIPYNALTFRESFAKYMTELRKLHSLKEVRNAVTGHFRRSRFLPVLL